MRRKRSPTHSSSAAPRPLRRTPEPSGGDVEKHPELAACPDCGASYREGRWTWEPAPADAYRKVCPACQRITDRYPAGELRAEGTFALTHRDELIRLMRHVEERERASHPLKRLIAIEETAQGFVAETTDAKLVQALGRALHKAYSGRLEQPPTSAERENLVRVRWVRD
jgi:NMD protein affecting ribosome stability and mRNA decay